MWANAHISTVMEHDRPSLIDQLRDAAAAWCAATGRTTGALSALVTNHGSFFERLGSTRSGFSTTTLEKFARFFADPASWPEEQVADAALAFAHIVLGNPLPADLSPDSCADPIGAARPSAHSEARPEPVATPAGEGQPDDPSRRAGASGLSPCVAGQAAAPGDMLSRAGLA